MCERHGNRQKRQGAIAAVLRGAIRLYQLSISLVLGRRCRFLPSCSDYASEAIRLHGAARGSIMALARITRCHPWGDAGFDPVPQHFKASALRFWR